MQECPCSCIPESAGIVFVWQRRPDQTGWKSGFFTCTRTHTGADQYNTFERFFN